MVLYHSRHSQNQRGMAVYRPIQKERQASKAGTTESTYTKGYTTYGYIDSKARPVMSTVRLGFKNEAKTNPKYNFKA